MLLKFILSKNLKLSIFIFVHYRSFFLFLHCNFAP